MEPAFFSRGNTKTPMLIAITCLFSNVILNAIFFFQNFGYVGIILSSIISSYLNLSLIFIALLRKKHFYFEEKFLLKIIKIAIPSIIMFFTLMIVRNFFNINNYFAIINELILMIIAGLITYFAASYLSGSLDILLKSGFLKRRKK